MNEEEIKAQIEAVYKELSIKNPNYVKYKCPICKGYGKARGKFVNNLVPRDHVGDCFYCGGIGVARRRKRSND